MNVVSSASRATSALPPIPRHNRRVARLASYQSDPRRGVAHRGEHRQAAGADAQTDAYAKSVRRREMIHLIGTAHERTQYWSDAIRCGESTDTNSEIVQQFEQYLRNAVASLAATAIAEELSQKCVEERAGGMSVCKKVADDLGLHHLFCDPDHDERRKLNITTTDQRESVWASRVATLAPNETSVIFVCGVDHCSTFLAKLEQRGLRARIHCDDWTSRLS
jgi:hypothetical protein